MPVIDYKTLTAIALGFALASAWSDAAATTLRSWYPGGGKSAHAMIVYAIVVTIVIILIVALINRLGPSVSGLVSHFKDKRSGKINTASLGPIISW